MWVSEEMQMVYLASPKTASKATKEALRPFGFEKVKGHHTVPEEHPGPNWTVFTTVRNHWDAWVSWFFFSGPRGLPFGKAWIRRWLHQQQGYYPHPSLGMYWLYTRMADRVFKYENDLERDLQLLISPELVLPKVNVGTLRKGRDYRRFYDDETREYVGKQFATEIEDYGYEF
jgi:hypothetical protein